MLLVVCPNLAVDRILTVDRFSIHEVQRSRGVITQPGGKGSNVARVFRQLGGDVALIGFAGRSNANSIREPLRQLGVFVETIEGWNGESRTCTIILDSATNDHPTVINEESGEVESQAIEAMIAVVDKWLPRATTLLVTGSLSRGLPEDFYADIIRRANAGKIYTAIDASGAALRHGLGAQPSLLKANFEEISGVAGTLPREPREIGDAIRRWSNAPSQTIVTLGEAGAVLVAGDQTWLVAPPRISHVNPIGAGDAFAAGYLKALIDGRSPADALRFAVAVAASDAATPEPGWIDTPVSE